MSVKVMSVVWESRIGTPSLKAVLLKLADCAADDGTRCYPSVPRVAAETELSERTVTRALGDLREKGLISIVAEGGGARSTEYQINLSALAELGKKQAMAQTQDVVSPLTECHPCHGVTPDTVSPDPCHGVTSPLTQCHPTPDTVSPSTINNHPITINHPPGAGGFEEFYGWYPKPEGKVSARKAYEAAVKAGVDPAAILAGLRRYIARCASRGTQERYHPMPERWIAERRWEDGDFVPAKPAAIAEKPYDFGPDAPEWKRAIAETKRVTEMHLTAWIKPLVAELDGDVCRVFSPRRSHADWVRMNLRSDVDSAIFKQYPNVKTIEYEVRA